MRPNYFHGLNYWVSMVSFVRLPNNSTWGPEQQLGPVGTKQNKFNAFSLHPTHIWSYGRRSPWERWNSFLVLPGIPVPGPPVTPWLVRPCQINRWIVMVAFRPPRINSELWTFHAAVPNRLMRSRGVVWALDWIYIYTVISILCSCSMQTEMWAGLVCKLEEWALEWRFRRR